MKMLAGRHDANSDNNNNNNNDDDAGNGV